MLSTEQNYEIHSENLKPFSEFKFVCMRFALMGSGNASQVDHKLHLKARDCSLSDAHSNKFMRGKFAFIFL